MIVNGPLIFRRAEVLILPILADSSERPEEYSSALATEAPAVPKRNAM